MQSQTSLLPVADLSTLRLRRSEKWRSYPEDVLPLTVAEMDFDLAEPIRDALRQAVERSDTGYARPAPDLGQALAQFAADRWGLRIDPAQVHAVTDVGVGVVELLRLLTGPGDSVVISPPVYPPFFHWTPEAGRRLVQVPLTRDSAGSWQLDLAGLEEAFRLHPAVYVLCNPHNPVGLAHSRADLSALVALAQRYQVRIIADEIHAPLVLPGAEFTPLLSVPGAAEVGLSVLSASKAWNLAGLKCAAIVTADAPMRALVDQLPPDARWRVGHFGVLATVAAFTDGGPWLDQLLATLNDRRTLLGKLLAARLPRVRWTPPQATFLSWLDCRDAGAGDQPHELFLNRARVALEPGPHFGPSGQGFVRLNFGTSRQVLDQAVEAMASALDATG